MPNPKAKPGHKPAKPQGKPASKPGFAKSQGKPARRPRPVHTEAEPKSDLIYGLHAVEEALKARRRKFYRLLLARETAFESIKDREVPKDRFAGILELAQGLTVEYVSAQTLERLTKSEQHQGIAAKVGPLRVLALDDVLAKASVPCQLLLLDGITDPHNLGALLRTALCAGFAAVVTTKDRAVEATPTVAKVSSGALEYIPLITVTNLATTIKELKAKDFWVAGLAADGDGDIYQTDLRGNFALVVGSEGKGLRPLVRSACDLIVSIPQQGPLDSLNASVAGGIAIYEIYRQNHR